MSSTSKSFIATSSDKSLAMAFAEFAHTGAMGVYEAGNAPYFLMLVEAFAVDSVYIEETAPAFVRFEGGGARVVARFQVFRLKDNSYLTVGFIPSTSTTYTVYVSSKAASDTCKEDMELVYEKG